MKRITKILLAVLAAMFLSACGGSSSGGSGVDTSNNAVDTSSNSTVAELANNDLIDIHYNISEEHMNNSSKSVELNANSDVIINIKEIKDAGDLSCLDLGDFQLTGSVELDGIFVKSYLSSDYTRQCVETYHSENSVFYGSYTYASSMSVNY